MRYIVIAVDLDDDHPLWPNERVYKIKDTKTGEVGYGCYKEMSHAELRAKKKNDACR